MNKEIVDLFRKFIDNQCSSQELNQVFDYIKKGEFLKEWDAAIEEDEKDLVTKDNLATIHNFRKDALHDRILGRINNKSSRFIWAKYTSAALIIVASIVSFAIYETRSSHQDIREKVSIIEDVDPGGDAATLTLSDGTTIELNEKRIGELGLQENVNIIKSSEGELIYKPLEGNKTVTFNMLSTPRGGQYQLTLPDGTKVWLNAASSIVYPTVFAGEKRSVKVEGEVYFEVMPIKDQPFFVETSGQTIEVIGTHFNVNAYDDEGVIRTTLLEGKVKVTLPSSKFSILGPGQQSIVNPQKDHIAQEKVDVEATTGWKNGDLYFHNTDLNGVMRQLARWYDVDVDFRGMPDRRLNGIISRNVNLSIVLEAIEQTSNIHLKIESMPKGLGRRISME